MNYRHITISLSLEGLSPKKLVSDMEDEGFEPFYSKLVATCSRFLCGEDPFKKYKKITAKKGAKTNENGEIVIQAGVPRAYYSYEELVVKENESPSFGELFRHKKYTELIFALFDTSTPDDQTTWFCCWTNKNNSLIEPLDFFVTTVLKVIGCDKSLEEIKNSDTFSMTHGKVVEELKEYDLKQTSLGEKKSTFKLISDPQIRDILIEFNKKNNILLSDFLENRKAEEKEKLERTLNFLSGQGLLDKNLIVICNKSWSMVEHDYSFDTKA